MQTESIKAQAHQLLDNMPDSATWEDVMYRIYGKDMYPVLFAFAGDAKVTGHPYSQFSDFYRIIP